MIETILAVVAITAICYVVARLAGPIHRNHTEQAEAELRGRLHEADAQVSAEHRRARRAMNDAAGQSWRNLAG